MPKMPLRWTLDLQFHSQLHSITTLWPASNYTQTQVREQLAHCCYRKFD